MTVQAQNSVQYYNGPIEIGTELSIVEFTFIDNSHVSAKVRGNTEVWQYGYDYTVSGAQTLIRTITVQRRVAENEVLAVYLDVPITQNISPEEGGNFPASTNEYVLDKLTHISQMLDERVKRSLQISIDTPFSGTLPAPEPNKALKISSDGNSFVMSDYDPDLALVLTENFKNQAQQAAIEAENQKNVAIQQAGIATQQAGIATQQAQNATTQATNAKISADSAAQSNQSLTTNYNTYMSQITNEVSQGINSLNNASNAVKLTNVLSGFVKLPDYIKLVVHDGTMYLRAGSRLIVPYGTTDLSKTIQPGDTFINSNFKVHSTQFCPNGTPDVNSYTVDKFFVWVTTQADIAIKPGGDWLYSTHLVTINLTDNNFMCRIDHEHGPVTPPRTYRIFYNTTENRVYDTEEPYLNKVMSFPIAFVAVNPAAVCAILHRFNGIGLIGGYLWSDKEHTISIPLGKNNIDGSVNNELVTSTILTLAEVTWDAWSQEIILDRWNNIITAAQYYECAYPPCVATVPYVLWLNPQDNWLRYTDVGTRNNWRVIADWSVTDMRFSTTQVEPGIRRLDHITPPQPGLQVVRASKISAMSNLPNLANIGRDISLGASGAEYTSPGNGYIGVMFKNSTACNLHSATVGINSVNFYQTTKLDRYAYIPILKGQKFNLFYDTAGSLAYFKFIPAQGEV